MDEPCRFCQPIPPEEEGGWEEIPAPEECGEPLVDVTNLSPRIVYGAAYRGRGIPGAMDRCLVRRGVWERLRAAAELLPEDHSLLIFDALRPLCVQRALYEDFRAEVLMARPELGAEELERVLDDFVAKPVKNLRRPAPHTTGGAVDLTLCRDGVLLDMGTAFDDFTPRAHTRYFEGTAPAEEPSCRDNRRLLYHLMGAVGMVSYGGEWWHYAYGERLWARRQGRAPIYGFCPACE